MNKIIKFLLLFIFCTKPFFLIQAFTKESSMQFDLIDLDAILNNFIKEQGKKTGKKYKMRPCGIGGGIEDKIWLMTISFQRYGDPLTEMQARKLILLAVQDYLEAVNQDEKIRPFLRDYPFTAKNIEMSIFNYTKERDDVYHPYIDIISACEGRISYLTCDEANPLPIKSDVRETYEKALEILKQDKQDPKRQDAKID